MRKMTIMPFGKHKGLPLDEIPRKYLIWAMDTLDLDDQLTHDIQAVAAGLPLPMTREEKVKAIIGKGKTQ